MTEDDGQDAIIVVDAATDKPRPIKGLRARRMRLLASISESVTY